MRTLIRLTIAVSIVGAVAAFLVASGGEAPVPPEAPGPRQAALDAERAAAVESSVARLRARLADMPARPEGTRNPFHFERRASSLPASVPRTVVADAPESESGASAPVRPSLRLIGMAEDVRDGVTDRTAVVSGLNQVYLVKEGEQIAMRFLVHRVGADAIEVEDLVDGTPITLGLQ